MSSVPFQFCHAEIIEVHDAISLNTLSELFEFTEVCSAEYLTNHLVHAYRRHNYLGPAFINDFALWIEQNYREPTLTAQVASITQPSIFNTDTLRAKLRYVLSQFVNKPIISAQPTIQPLVLNLGQLHYTPLPIFATTLKELSSMMWNCTEGAIYNHFVLARIKLNQPTNDFSQWIRAELGLLELASQIDLLNCYKMSLTDLRKRIAHTLEHYE